MSNASRNAALPDDAKVAEQLLTKANELAALMTQAKKMGLDFSFDSIRADNNGVFSVQNARVTKVIG